MDNSRLSSLVYRIIGKPDRWHDDYIDIMHQVLDETDAIDNATNFNELEIGSQILNRISDSKETLEAVGALLDKSRFKMIILDHEFRLIYKNQNAKDLAERVLDKNSTDKLKLGVLTKIKSAAKQNQILLAQGKSSGLSALDYDQHGGQQLYLRSIANKHQTPDNTSNLHLLLILDPSANNKELNPQLTERYGLTDKEQSVLINLIHGKNIREIAASSFVSENTVKTHLKALFRKTDTKSQTDIVRLILTDESQILDSYFGGDDNILSSLPSKKNNSDKFIRLKSRLKIAYREYGPSDGHPIVVCHNGYGCRVTIPNEYEESCVRQNKRIIIPDRPGYGLTPYYKGHPDNWNDSLAELIDRLELQEYDLLGTVLGSVFALNYAVQADSRLKRVRLSSPVFVNSQADANYLTGIFAPSTRLVRASNRFAREIYELWLKSVTTDLSGHYRRMLENSLGSAEAHLLNDSQTIELMIDGFRQASSHTLEGISREMVYCLSPKNVNLSKIRVPVDLWWGSEDNRISLAGVKNIVSQLNDATLHVREGYSEHIYYALFEEIIS